MPEILPLLTSTAVGLSQWKFFTNATATVTIVFLTHANTCHTHSTPLHSIPLHSTTSHELIIASTASPPSHITQNIPRPPTLIASLHIPITCLNLLTIFLSLLYLPHTFFFSNLLLYSFASYLPLIKSFSTTLSPTVILLYITSKLHIDLVDIIFLQPSTLLQATSVFFSSSGTPEHPTYHSSLPDHLSQESPVSTMSTGQEL